MGTIVGVRGARSEHMAHKTVEHRVVKLSQCPSSHSFGNKLARLLWRVVWRTLYRPSPRPFHAWRRALLRLFGAKIGRGAHPYPSADIWAPWNLEMGDYSCLSEEVDCYSVGQIRLGSHATVSQYSFLCTASHDYTLQNMPLTSSPIVIERGAWVAADVFVGPGVTVGEGSVVGARSTVMRDVMPWVVVCGNPARVIRSRTLNDIGSQGEV